jgi:plasmid maintenance system antidote protein VapI
MEENQKNQIITLIQTEKDRLGSFAAVAKKCKVSEATISLCRNNKWDNVTDEMALRIAQELGYKNDNWVICKNTRDFVFVSDTLANAKKKAMFIIISNEAGEGKTTGMENYCNENAANGAFYIKSREWSSKVLLIKMMTMLGMQEPKGYHTADQLIDIVVEALSERANQLPIICIDEFDKLKPSAKRVWIYLFNALEDRIAVAVAGTENLKKEIEAGVKYAKQGYDEIESRFGRSYISLIGSNKTDVQRISQANGIKDAHILAMIWEEVGKKYKKRPNGKNELVCDDLRRLKRVIQREKLRANA